MPLVVKNTFFDLVDQAVEAPTCGSTKRSNSVPKDCKFKINTEDQFNILADGSTVASDTSPVALSDVDVVNSSEDDMQSCVSVCEEVLQMPTPESSMDIQHFHSIVTTEKPEEKRPVWMDWSAKASLPADRRTLRNSTKNWGSRTARLNALDLCSSKSSKNASSKASSLKKAKRLAEDVSSDAPTRAGSAKFEEQSEGWTENISDVGTIEATEARFHDESDDELDGKAKIPIQLCVLMPEDAVGVSTVETKLKASAATFMPASCGIGQAAMVIGAAQMALNAFPQVTSIERCDGTLGTITTLLAKVRDESEQTAAASKAALDAAKAAMLSSAALSGNVYVIGYLTECPFEDFEDGSGFAASLGFVTGAQEDTACWDTFQKGFCPRRSTCRWCHPSESDLVRVHVSVQ